MTLIGKGVVNGVVEPPGAGVSPPGPPSGVSALGGEAQVATKSVVNAETRKRARLSKRDTGISG